MGKELSDHSSFLYLHNGRGRLRGFPGGANGKGPARQCRKHKRCGFDPWVDRQQLEIKKFKKSPLEMKTISVTTGKGKYGISTF